MTLATFATIVSERNGIRHKNLERDDDDADLRTKAEKEGGLRPWP